MGTTGTKGLFIFPRVTQEVDGYRELLVSAPTYRENIICIITRKTPGKIMTFLEPTKELKLPSEQLTANLENLERERHFQGETDISICLSKIVTKNINMNR